MFNSAGAMVRIKKFLISSKMESRRNHSSLLLFLVILRAAGDATSSEKDVDFFSCLSYGEVNYTTPYAQVYHRIFELAAYNLRITKSVSSKPTAIILPESKEQLATTIICCKKWKWTFTIRSGGHSFEGLSYSAGNHQFVMIDLMNLNRVSVNLELKMAWAEGGATVGEIYHAIGRSSNHHGFSAGLCPAVGSGGHIGGGGYGLMSRKYGLASDNVVDAILVDAEGELLDRNMMGEDVFWAIRGGGAGSWGAIYSWKIRLIDVPKTVTAFRITRRGSKTEAAKLLYKWQLVAPFLEDELTLMVTVITETDIIAVFQGLYLGPKVSVLASINHAYPELELVASECNEMSWIESMAYFPGVVEGYTVEALKDRFATSDQKFYYKWKGDYVRERISIEGIEGILEMLMKEPRGQLELSPLGGMMARIQSNMLPFPHREGNLYSIGYLVAWDEGDDERSGVYMDWIRTVHEYMTPFVSKGPRAAYVNEIDLDLGVMNWEKNHKMSPDELVELGRAWGDKYFLGNYDRLVRAKTLIDPNNVFRHQQSIPPKSFEVLAEGMNQYISC